MCLPGIIGAPVILSNQDNIDKWRHVVEEIWHIVLNIAHRMVSDLLKLFLY
jgi:hypothetical protein